MNDLGGAVSGRSSRGSSGRPIVLETADAELLARPMRTLADVAAVEAVPLADRLGIVDFSRRIDIALAARAADDVAIHYVPDGDVHRPAVELTFGALRRDITRMVRLLRARGVGRCDAVAVLLPAVPQIYCAMLGAMAASIAYPVNWMLEPHLLLHLLREANVKAVVALGPTPGFRIWESLEAIRADLPGDPAVWSVPGPDGTVLPDSDLDTALAAIGDEGSLSPPPHDGDDIAAYVHSGGTTGLPKIVKIAHRGLSYRHWSFQLALKLEVNEVNLHDTPMFHIGGVARCFPPLASGSSILIPSIMGARDRRYIGNYWKFVEKYGVTRLSAVPTTLAVLSKAPPQGEDLSSLKPYFITGSTALPIPVREAFERISGVRVLNSYGMTENTSSIALDLREGEAREGSSGIRLPYSEIRAAVMDAQGRNVRLCGPDEIGMLQVNSAGIAPGYLNPVHDRGAWTEDGWFVSGDLGRVDDDGYVFVTGRAKDVIIRGGHNIDPALIEEPLLQSPDVLLAAAVGKPDAYAGELPIAYVQLVPGSQANEATLLAFVETRIGERAAVPKEIIVLDKLPLTDIGKPIKTQLRKDAAERTFRAVLSEALGDGDDCAIDVEVRPHPTLGTLVAVTLSCRDVAQGEERAERARDVMGQYSLAHAIELRSVA